VADPAGPSGPLERFDAWRETAPVVLDELTRTHFVTRYADVWNLLVDRRLGARRNSHFIDRLSPEDRTASRPVFDFLAGWPVFLDPPRHHQVHRLIMPAFQSAEVRSVQAATLDFLRREPSDKWVEAGLLAGLIHPACREGLRLFLGVSEQDLGMMTTWSAAIMAFVGRDVYDAQATATAKQALDHLAPFTRAAVAEEKSTLARNLNRGLLDGTIGEQDVTSVYGQLLTAFLEPTVSVAAKACEFLLADPRWAESYARDPDSFIEEATRLASPFHFAPRHALSDIRVEDSVIAEGSRVVLLLVSANRDPRVFARPEEFIPSGREAPHVAFARGRHACVGAALARTLVRIVLDAARQVTWPAGSASIRWRVGPGTTTVASNADIAQQA
jgi:cytochrome P450